MDENAITPEFELDNTPEMDIENNIANSATIAEMQNAIKALQNRVAELENRENNSYNISAIQTSIDQINSDNQDQSFIISEIRDTVASLKNDFSAHKREIRSLETKVVRDDEYLNFKDWCKNVYLVNASDPINTFARGDIYINCNKNIAATNSAYINIRPINSTDAYSEDDWQAMYRASSSL
jgi:predicted RNase H-like nuclease (RuvC/YqgF family)